MSKEIRNREKILAFHSTDLFTFVKYYAIIPINTIQSCIIYNH